LGNFKRRDGIVEEETIGILGLDRVNAVLLLCVTTSNSDMANTSNA